MVFFLDTQLPGSFGKEKDGDLGKSPHNVSRKKRGKKK